MISASFGKPDRAEQKQASPSHRIEGARYNAPIQVGASLITRSMFSTRPEASGRCARTRGVVYLDNRVYKGRAGYEIIMPLRIDGTDVHLLVNRGWVAGTGDRQRLPEFRTPEERVAVTGIAVIPGTMMYELSEAAIEGKVWQNLSIERYSARSGYSVQPVVVRQTNDLADGLIRDWTVSNRAINVHRSYAFQWNALAVLVLVVYLVMSFTRDASKP